VLFAALIATVSWLVVHAPEPAALSFD